MNNVVTRNQTWAALEAKRCDLRQSHTRADSMPTTSGLGVEYEAQNDLDSYEGVSILSLCRAARLMAFCVLTEK
jgi:hypothetical protein